MKTKPLLIFLHAFRNRKSKEHEDPTTEAGNKTIRTKHMNTIKTEEGLLKSKNSLIQGSVDPYEHKNFLKQPKIAESEDSD